MYYSIKSTSCIVLKNQYEYERRQEGRSLYHLIIRDDDRKGFGYIQGKSGSLIIQCFLSISPSMTPGDGTAHERKE